MNDEKREAMIAAAGYALDRWRCQGAVREIDEVIADFALAQMRPLEDRIAELERQLAVAVDALEWIEAYDNYTLSLSAPSKKASEALAQIRSGAAAGKPAS